MAVVAHTTRRTVLAIAGVTATLSTGAVAPTPTSAATALLTQLKQMKATALEAWRLGRPDAEDRRNEFMVAARNVLRQPSRCVADLGVKAWIADVSVDGGDIGMIAAPASQVLAGDVRRLAGV